MHEYYFFFSNAIFKPVSFANSIMSITFSGRLIPSVVTSKSPSLMEARLPQSVPVTPSFDRQQTGECQPTSRAEPIQSTNPWGSSKSFYLTLKLDFGESYEQDTSMT